MPSHSHDEPAAPPPAASERRVVLRLAVLLLTAAAGAALAARRCPDTPGHEATGRPSGPGRAPGAAAAPAAADTAVLTERSLVLLHGPAPRAPLPAATLSDRDPAARIDYATLADRAAIDARLRELGVTHVAWPRAGLPEVPLAAELPFFEYTLALTRPVPLDDEHLLAALPAAPVPPGPRTQITLIAGCSKAVHVNFLSELDAAWPDIERRSCNTVTLNAQGLLDFARATRFVLVDGRMDRVPGELLRAGFVPVPGRGSLRGFVNPRPALFAPEPGAPEPPADDAAARGPR